MTFYLGNYFATLNLNHLFGLISNRVKVSLEYMPEAIYALWANNSNSSLPDRYLEQACKCCIFVGLTESIDETVLQWFDSVLVRLRRPDTVIVIADSTSCFYSVISEYCSDHSLLLLPLEGFRNLQWGIRSIDLPENLIYSSPLEICKHYIKEVECEKPTKILFRARRLDAVRLYTIYSTLQSSLRAGRFECTGNVGTGDSSYQPVENVKQAYEAICSYKGVESIPEIEEPFIFRGFWNQDQQGGWDAHEQNLYSIRKYFYLEIVGEHYEYQTEKTFKPMLLGMPCFWIGKKGSIKLLHQQGFWTFDQWWDESYDELDYTFEKVDRVFQEIDKVLRKPISELRAIYQEMIPTLLHNATLFGTPSQQLQRVCRELNKSVKLV